MSVLRTNGPLVFGNQFIVSTIKFRKGFSKFFFEVYDTDSPVGEVLPLNIYFER